MQFFFVPVCDLLVNLDGPASFITRLTRKVEGWKRGVDKIAQSTKIHDELFWNPREFVQPSMYNSCICHGRFYIDLFNNCVIAEGWGKILEEESGRQCSITQQRQLHG